MIRDLPPDVSRRKVQRRIEDGIRAMNPWQEALAAAQQRRAIWVGVFAFNASGVVVWGWTGLTYPWAFAVAAVFVPTSISAFRVLLARNRDLADARVMETLGALPYNLDGASIAELTGYGSGRLYPALARLERSGRIVSWWDDGPSPRKRFYRIAMQEKS